MLRGIPDRADGVLGLSERELRVAGVAVAWLGDPGPGRCALPHDALRNMTSAWTDVGVMANECERQAMPPARYSLPVLASSPVRAG